MPFDEIFDLYRMKRDVSIMNPDNRRIRMTMQGPQLLFIPQIGNWNCRQLLILWRL